MADKPSKAASTPARPFEMREPWFLLANFEVTVGWGDEEAGPAAGNQQRETGGDRISKHPAAWPRRVSRERSTYASARSNLCVSVLYERGPSHTIAAWETPVPGRCRARQHSPHELHAYRGVRFAAVGRVIPTAPALWAAPRRRWITRMATARRSRRGRTGGLRRLRSSQRPRHAAVTVATCPAAAIARPTRKME
jgi:hypothetical protein